MDEEPCLTSEQLTNLKNSFAIYGNHNVAVIIRALCNNSLKLKSEYHEALCGLEQVLECDLSEFDTPDKALREIRKQVREIYNRLQVQMRY